MFVLCLSEHYDLPNPDEKYDVIPEIWNGKNIADFIDPDIMKVITFQAHFDSTSLIALKTNVYPTSHSLLDAVSAWTVQESDHYQCIFLLWNHDQAVFNRLAK